MKTIKCKRCDEYSETYWDDFEYCSKCCKELVKGKTSQVKHQAIEYRGGKCCICGYDDFPSALEFHHLDPSEKEMHFRDIKNLKFNDIKDELDKCIILCARCHREYHAIKSLKRMKRDPSKYQKKMNCGYCDKEFAYDTRTPRRFCSLDCHTEYAKQNLVRVKVEDRPPVEKLQEMINSMAYTDIAKLYGVTHTTIRKWAKKYGIQRDPDVVVRRRRFESVTLLQEDGTKICMKCHRELLAMDFTKAADRPDGLLPICRGCSSSHRAEKTNFEKKCETASL